MNGLDSDRLKRFAELLALAFYGLMLIALAAILSGALGFGFLFLLLGSAAHVLRVGLEELATPTRRRVERPSVRPVGTPRQAQATPRVPRPRPATRQVAMAPAEERRRVRLGG
jgi:uncharacterized protein (DUF58 family)